LRTPEPVRPWRSRRVGLVVRHRRWNWLNYYDFSLNNFLRLGFNDIRLRDEQLKQQLEDELFEQLLEEKIQNINVKLQVKF
jgi:hypothetical protein